MSVEELMAECGMKKGHAKRLRKWLDERARHIAAGALESSELLTLVRQRKFVNDPERYPPSTRSAELLTEVEALFGLWGGMLARYPETSERFVDGSRKVKVSFTNIFHVIV